MVSFGEPVCLSHNTLNDYSSSVDPPARETLNGCFVSTGWGETQWLDFDTQNITTIEQQDLSIIIVCDCSCDHPTDWHHQDIIGFIEDTHRAVRFSICSNKIIWENNSLRDIHPLNKTTFIGYDYDSIGIYDINTGQLLKYIFFELTDDVYDNVLYIGRLGKELFFEVGEYNGSYQRTGRLYIIDEDDIFVKRASTTYKPTEIHRIIDSENEIMVKIIDGGHDKDKLSFYCGIGNEDNCQQFPIEYPNDRLCETRFSVIRGCILFIKNYSVYKMTVGLDDTFDTKPALR